MTQQPLELEDASKNSRLNLDTDEKKVDIEAYDMSIATIKVEEEDEIEVFTWFNGVFNHQTCRATTMDTFQSELESLIAKGILVQTDNIVEEEGVCEEAECGPQPPTLDVSTKDGQVRWVPNFQGLNRSYRTQELKAQSQQQSTYYSGFRAQMPPRRSETSNSNFKARCQHRRGSDDAQHKANTDKATLKSPVIKPMRRMNRVLRSRPTPSLTKPTSSTDANGNPRRRRKNG
jgi:hypothetical protein